MCIFVYFRSMRTYSSSRMCIFVYFEGTALGRARSSTQAVVSTLYDTTLQPYGCVTARVTPFYVSRLLLRVGTLRAQHSECVPSHSFTQNADHTPRQNGLATMNSLCSLGLPSFFLFPQSHVLCGSPICSKFYKKIGYALIIRYPSSHFQASLNE